MPESSLPEESLPEESPVGASQDDAREAIRDELADHLALAAAEIERGGASAAEAEKLAHARFGDAQRIARKCWWIAQGDEIMRRYIAAAVVVMMIGLLLASNLVGIWSSRNEIETDPNDPNRRSGRALVDKAITDVHWQFWVGKSEQGYVREFAENLQSHEYNTRVIRPDSDDDEPKAPKDDFEAKLIARWKQAPANSNPLTLQFADRMGDSDQDDAEYQYYQAVRAKAKCIDCHRAIGATIKSGSDLPENELTEGDLLGIVKVGLPGEKMQQAVSPAPVSRLPLASASILVATVAIVLVVVLSWKRPIDRPMLN